MGILEDRWEKRRAEEAMRARTPAQERAGQEGAELAGLESELAEIELSTMSVAAKPFEAVGVIQGVPCEDPATALLRLKEQARAQECDAVYGVNICPAVSGAVVGGNGVIPPQFFAYGTGVRWLPPRPSVSHGRSEID